MPSFAGFPAGKVHLTRVPEQFFRELLPTIDDLGELKITLYALWRLDQQEGSLRFFTFGDCLEDETLMRSWSADLQTARAALQDALRRAVQRGTLLEQPADAEIVYLLNSPRGRAALNALRQGKWSPQNSPHPLRVERPNIFQLYEENIGPLTPLIADALREAETVFPAGWIEDAFRIAVKNNVRRWRYIEAILDSWQEKGRDEQNRQDAETDRRRYTEGEFGKFFEH